jgi:hypothetical protein
MPQWGEACIWQAENAYEVNLSPRLDDGEREKQKHAKLVIPI